MFNPKNSVGAIRTAVQAFFASVILIVAPVLKSLGILEDVSAIAGLLTSVIVALAVALYWMVFNWAQTSPKVQGNPALKFLVKVLMGGSTPPVYVPELPVE